MSYENLRPANFMRHLATQSAGSGNFKTIDVHTVDQCALQEQLERKAQRRRDAMGVGNGPMMPMRSMEDWQREHRLRERTERRGQRGGSNLGSQDAPEKY